jgi:2-polyprenyl-3-methyl-5-hydroxy-6-metoxy-1,4-benzoquinol methylase
VTDAAGYYDRYWTEGVNGWAVEAGLSVPLRETLVDVVSGRRVLDYGGGDGARYGAVVRAHAARYAVADVSREVLARRAAQGDLAIEVEHLGSYENAFEVLLVLEVLEHLLDPAGALLRAVRTLQPGGTALISVPNAFNWRNRLRMVAGRLPASGVGPPGVRGRTYTAAHIRFFDTESLLELCRRAGLSVESVQTDGVDLWKSTRLMRERMRPVRMDRAASLVADCLIVRARRAS